MLLYLHTHFLKRTFFSGGCKEVASTQQTMVNTTTSFHAQRASGCLFGLAFGDALGAETVFLSVNEILHSFPPDGPLQPPGDPARVTDDTQMALAVGSALLVA